MSIFNYDMAISTPFILLLKRVMCKLVILFVLIGCVNSLAAQTIIVEDTNLSTIFTLENDLLSDQNSNVLATIKGNIIFEGESNNKKDILLMAKLSDIFTKKLDFVYDKNLKEEIFAVEKGFFYLNGNNSDLIYLVGYYEISKNGNWLLKHGQTDELLLTISGEIITTGQLVAIMYYCMKHYKIDASLSDDIIELEKSQSDISNTSGSIRKLWGDSFQEYIWDGTTIKPKWGNRDFFEWKFDGYTLERAWYGDADAFEWDGRVLKRKWYNSKDEFEVFGSTIKPRYGGFGEEYVLQGNILKNPWNPGTNDEWEIKGDVPLPIIILVVFGLIAK